ncbi:low-density lipoprotein receptor class A domain-containing protein 1-like [Salminus brasiliensis]|uniref:low-density lipoprotein receptor class A domain-containing protein 1-like n=1 Tax=Salminus brasiliensis TaxID=930266 RepID=UPI003B83A575
MQYSSFTFSSHHHHHHHHHHHPPADPFTYTTLPVCLCCFISGDLPENLPSNLIFRCDNPRVWTFTDNKCNRINDCGDCSDETSVYASCPPCSGEWWSCTPVDFQYCDCIPRHFCRDGRQHCFDWSDEYICPKTYSESKKYLIPC